jgi:hypothetical protein
MEQEQRISETCTGEASTSPPPPARPASQASPPPVEAAEQATNGTSNWRSANGNRLQHAIKSDPAKQAHRLVLGSLPPSLARVERQARQFRSAVEQAVMDRYGAISVTQACFVNSAARWERHAMLATRWLRERADAMDDATRLSYSRDIARASSERDKALAALKLDRDAGDLDGLYDDLRRIETEATG